MKYILEGTVVTFDGADQVLSDGLVCIQDKLIMSVVSSRQDVPKEFSDAVMVETDCYIYPGLIDLHNHLPFNYLSLWKIDRRFTDRYQWPTLKNYNLEISLPTNLLAITNAIELVKYCETKSLLGGVTTIDGYSKFKGSYAAWLLRNVEVEPFGKLEPPIYQSVLPLKPEEFEGYSKKMDNCDAFIYHLAEGTNKALVKEYDDLKIHNLVRDRLVAIHCTALTAKHFKDFGKANARMVWSPLSNILLYGSTAKVVSAKKNGVLICLGPDWTPTGSKNLLWELKVADLINKKSLRGVFSNKELVDMVTINPAKAIRWDDRIGKIAPTYMADLLVTERLAEDPYISLIKTTEKNIRLVAIEGRPRFGDPEILGLLGVNGYETIQVDSKNKAIDILEPNATFGDLTLQQIKINLTNTLQDPKKAANNFLNNTKLLRVEEMPPQLIIEAEAATPNESPYIANGSLGAVSFSSVLKDVINLKDNELSLLPRELDPLTMYETKERFFDTIKSNKNVPKYLYELENYLSA